MFRKIIGLRIVGLAAAMIVALNLRAFAEDHKGHDHRPKITVKGMCCQVEAKAAEKELLKVKGVKKVTPDVKAGTLTIETDKKAPSPKEMWEATEKAKLKVVQLTMDHDKFTSKPKK